MKITNKVILLFLTCLILSLMGCSKSKDPLEVINEYYNNIKSNNYDSNYDYLSSDSKNIWTKEQYQAWADANNQVCTLKSVKITKTNEFTNKEMDGIEYESVIEYNIMDTSHDNAKNEDKDTEYTRDVVKENGEWKIYIGNVDPKKYLVSSEWQLAGMYENGEGKTKNLSMAVSTMRYAIEVDPDYSPSYYILGLIYNEDKRYDEAIKSEQQCIDKANNDEDKSNGYFGLAEAYNYKEDYSSAKEYYEKAIEVNSENQNAKDKLADLSSK